MSQLWYVAYGSNISSRHFRSRFRDIPSRGEIWQDESWVRIPHELYFASSSQTWGGSAVAFISLDRFSSGDTVGHGFLIDEATFGDVLAAEHLWIPLDWDSDLLELSVGAWCPLPTKAKYNAVVRLSDLADHPSFAVTTARSFERGQPSDAYLDTFREGLSSAPFDDLDGYLAAAVARSLREESRWRVPPLAGAPLAWRRTLSPHKSTGYPTVQLGSDESWLGADGPLLGQVEADGRSTDAWLLPPQGAKAAGASPQVFRGLGYSQPFPDRVRCRLTVDYPLHLRRIPAMSEDVELADHVQVAPETARLLGRWALLVSPNLSGPVSLSPRNHVPTDAVRVAYASRELWEFESDTGTATLLPLDVLTERRWRTSGIRSWLARKVGNTVEALLGAPAIALRATEGVVGDEGRSVVRVDASALDFLGVRAGEEVVVSWAGREATARALLQTPELRERMRVQYAETTGRQSRLSTRARTVGDENILWHLQTWVSPAIRDALVIPPDTVVRLRRSILHTLLRHLLALELPVGGLTIAVIAIPGVPLLAQIAIPVVALIVAFVPLRLPRT